MTDIERFESANGHQIYQIHLEVFPGFQGYSYVVFADEINALIDVGSGFGDCNDQLLAALVEIDALERLTHILISHGHIDHFGGLSEVRQRTTAQVGIHELDMRVVVRYEERLADVARRLESYLRHTGVDDEVKKDLMRMYQMSKQLFASTEVDFGFETVGMQIGPLQAVHVPGHSPGQVIFVLDEILFTSDHILDPISPHVAPESLSLHTGVGHYLSSLDKARPFCQKAELALGGHYRTMTSPLQRVNEITQLTHDRLKAVKQLLSQPRTITQISNRLFPGADGYHHLLALEETGAYVEYLAQRAEIGMRENESLEETPAEYVALKALEETM
jgi:glyoxylase-like metal-dependent hydrolase (beta-lactamase superfamily II)